MNPPTHTATVLSMNIPHEDRINHAAIDVCYEMLCTMLTESAGEVEQSTSGLSNNFRTLAENAAQQGHILEKIIRSFSELEHENSTISLDNFVQLMSENITNTIHKIVTISENAMELAFAMEGIIEQLTGIEEFIQKVNKINNQTRMLALNATIEAARAGEMGRGFSVVASEVKNVSSQIDGLAHEMREQIGLIAERLRGGQETLGRVASIDMSANITARARTEGLMKALLEQNGRISDIVRQSSQSMKAISQQIGHITIGVQFQDRNSQIISNIVALIRAMREHEKNPESYPLPADPAQALEEISRVISLSAIRQKLYTIASLRGKPSANNTAWHRIFPQPPPPPRMI